VTLKLTLFIKWVKMNVKNIIDRFSTSQLAHRLVKGTFWVVLGSVISRGLTFVATVIVARLLGKNIYGELGMIQSTVGMFGVLAGFGLGLTATKHVAEYREKDPERAGRIISISALVAFFVGVTVAAVFFMMAPILADKTMCAPYLTKQLKLGTLLLFFHSLNGAQTGALAGFEAFKKIAYINSILGLITFPVLLAGAYFGGLTGAIIGLAINLVISWLFNHIALRSEMKRYRIHFSFNNIFKETEILWHFSLPAVLSGILVGPIKWLCNAFLVNKTNGFGEMGVFSAALVFQSMLLFVSSMFNAPLLSVLSNSGNLRSRKLETTNILASWSIGLFPAIILLLFPEIMEILLGDQYKGKSFRITSSLIVFYTSILTYRSGLLRILQSQGQLWLGFMNNVVWGAVLIPCAFYMAKWGAIGIALAFALAYLVISIVFTPVYISKCKMPSSLLVSKESVSVWVIVMLLTVSVYFNIPLIFRFMVVPVIYAVVIKLFKRMWFDNTVNVVT